jgi:predicted kinase
MKKLTIIRGICGSGKTTLAKKLVAEDLGAYHMDPSFNLEMLKNHKEYKHLSDPILLRKAIRGCFYGTMNFIEKGFNVVLTAPFIRLSHIKRYIDAVKTVYDGTVKIIDMPSDPVISGEWKSPNNVSEEYIKRQLQRWEPFED